MASNRRAKAEGGSVHIHAHVRLGRLEISALDDGAGLSATQTRTGLALNNIRARLQARCGSNANLTLAKHGPGARAVIVLPLIGAAVDLSHQF